MTLNKLNNATLPQEFKAIQAFDPLRLLEVGKKITVEVALNPQTGALGIKFNGAFYPVELPIDAKAGQLLKVLLKANADQIILKLFNEVSGKDFRFEKTNSTKHLEPSILTKQERLQLREILLSSNKLLNPALPLNNENANSVTTKKQLITEKIITQQNFPTKKIDALLANISKEISNNKSAALDFQKVSLKLPQITNLHNTDNTATDPVTRLPNDSVTKFKLISKLETQQSIGSASKFSNNLPSILAIKDFIVPLPTNSQQVTPSKELIQQIITGATKQVMLQLMPLLKTNIQNEEEIFKIITQNILKHKLSSLDLITVKAVNSDSAIQPNIKLPTEDPLPKIFLNPKKTEQNINNLRNIAPSENITPKELQALEPLHRSLTQLALTTESLQRLHTNSPARKDGIYFLLPIFIGNNLHHAEGFMFSDNKPKEQPQKRKPKLTKIKITLPVLGDVTIELFSHGQEVQLTIYVESEKSKQYIEDARSNLSSILMGQGISTKSLNIFVSKKEFIAPNWVRQELGIAQTA